MQFLVTGGAGFIGSHVVDRLLAQGHAVAVIDDFNAYYNPAFKRANLAGAMKNSRLKVIEGDVSNKAQLDAAFVEARADMVIHLAARAGVRASVSDPFLYQRVNVEGTLNVLECARIHKVPKITFGSTSSVYGLNAKIPFSESDALLHTVSPYAATKLAGEALARSYSHLHGLKITVLRFFSVYGPRGRPDMAIYGFTEKMLAGQKIGMFGDGSSERDYTYVDDIVQGVLATVEKDFAFEIFNLGESQTISLMNLVSLLERSLNRKALTEHLPEQPGDVPRTYADISKSRKLLGYDPQTKIEAGIPKFVEWFLRERAKR